MNGGYCTPTLQHPGNAPVLRGEFRDQTDRGTKNSRWHEDVMASKVRAFRQRLTKLNQRNGTTPNYTYDLVFELTQVVQGATTTESSSSNGVGNRLSLPGMSLYH